MIILILGKPGSGKGSQAKRLAEQLGFFYFATGDFSRELAQKDPRIKKIVEGGALIPEKEMTSYISNYLEEKLAETKNIIFDGYPRYVGQYQFLEGWLADRNLGIDLIILLDVSDGEVIRRNSARRLDKKTGKTYNLITDPPPASVKKEDLVQREDDKESVIKKRLAVYQKNVVPMIDYIRAKGKLLTVDGARPIEVIQEELVKLIKEKLN